MLFYFDFETFYSKTVSLSKMSLRRYLRSTHITATSWRIDDTPTQVQLGEPNEATIKALTDAFANPDCIVIGHNAFAFDIRVAHYLLGIDWPVRARDTLGMARAAWPNLLKSYSLDNLSTVVVGCPKKLKIDLHAGKHTQLELEDYVARDVDACAHIYKAALPRLPAHELELLELTGRSCRMSLEVNRELGVKALDQFTQIVHENATQAAKDLHAEDTVDYARIFGLDGKTIKSVKPAGIKALLIENLGFQTNSISIKKANPEKLRQAPDAGAVLRSVGKANAALSHKRRVGALMQDDVVDLNLSYAGCFAAGTPVLTDRGWVAIEQVTTDDWLWDGQEWVQHEGLIDKGVMLTTTVNGVRLTPDHQILTDRGMIPTCQLKDSDSLTLGPDSGHGLWSGNRFVVPPPGSCPVGVAVDSKKPWISVISKGTCRKAVARVGYRPGKSRVTTSSLTRHFARTGRHGSAVCLNGATIRLPLSSPTMADAASESMVFGGNQFLHSCAGLWTISPDGIGSSRTPSRLTDGTMTEIMPPEICASSHIGSTNKTKPIVSRSSSRARKSAALNLNADSVLSRTKRRCSSGYAKAIRSLRFKVSTEPLLAVPVYDLTNAGPRHRYQVAGMIVSNSHTYRWTSTGTGKGVNFLNLPKHDKAVAKPIREMLSVQNMLLVRGDESALEYRMNGWLCSCAYICDLFEKQIFADPYSEFGFAATGKRCGPKDPIRQVWKACVLGLGFLMGVRTHALNLARMLGAALAESVVTGKPPKITLADLEQICKENGWRYPGGKYYNSVKTTTGLSETILTVAHFTHQLFHSVHPEMKRFADWLMICCEAVSRGCTARDLDDLYRHSAAPKKERLLLELDKGMHGPSLAVSCGPWSPTLRWSNLGVRDTPFGPAMCAITTRGDRKVTPNIVIENVTQAAGRNAVALGMLVLSTDHGYHDQLNIHDELLLAIDHRVSESELCTNLVRARDAMIEVCSPGGAVSNVFDWAAVIDPKKITVSATLWDSDPDDICPDFWKRIESHDYSVLDLLP